MATSYPRITEPVRAWPNHIPFVESTTSRYTQTTVSKGIALCKLNLAKERGRNLLLYRFHERLHPTLDIRLTLSTLPFELKQLMGQIERSQHGKLGRGRRIHPFRKMAHLAINKAREAPDISFVRFAANRVPLTVDFHINGLSQGPPPCVLQDTPTTRCRRGLFLYGT